MRDSGCGISESDQAKLFMPFSMLSANKQMNPNGTGMGLSICKQIAERMGGSTWVKSYEDLGSTFGFSFKCEIPDNRQIQAAGFGQDTIENSAQLPMNIQEIVTGYEPQQKATKKAKKTKHVYAPVPDCQKRILVADDMKFVIVAMEALIEDIFGISSENVTYVRDGQQALDEIKSNIKSSHLEGHQPFALLILDFNMPYLNGLQVVDQVKELYWRSGETHPPFFMMQTSNQDDEFKRRTESHGVDFFAEKPCTEEKLSKILMQLDFIASKPKSKKRKMAKKKSSRLSSDESPS